MAFFRKLKEMRLLILIICLGIIGYCLHKAVFVPISIELDSVRAEALAVNQKITTLPTKVRDLRRLRDDYREAVFALENINSKVTHESQLPYFVKELEGVSKDAGAKILGISVGNSQAGSFYSKVPITVALRGSYGQIRRFIQGLGKLGRAFSISDLGLESPGSSESEVFVEEPVLDASLSLVVYVVPKGGDN
ncbi:MAG: type 4a pilus biogenesis protein PilO [Firmicutes bacterium]|nr:type 4a pilus biogenesis protein PilO [Bacillota bacterium]HXL03753.1 type 4a pilus biogenesis protein PilO [Bacillota bacterium]